MEERQLIILDVKADESGNWEVESEQGIEAGGHAVVATDENGELDKAFFVVQEEQFPTIFVRVKEVMPSFYLYFGLLLLLLIVALLLNNIRLSEKVKRLIKKIKELHGFYVSKDRKSLVPGELEKKEKEEESRYKFFALTQIIFLIIGVVAIIGLVIFLFSSKDGFEEITAVDKVSGSVVEPFTGQMVENVDLTVGEVSIRTGSSGQYVFPQLGDYISVRITHPGLTKAVVKKVEDNERMDIYFDVGMYNILSFIVDLDIRGRYKDIYDKYLDDELKQNVDINYFLKSHQSVFNEDNILDQDLIVKSVKTYDEWFSKRLNTKFAKVVEINLENRHTGEIGTYFLRLNDEGGWGLVF